MSTVMDEDVKRWTAKAKAALVAEIILGKTTVAEAGRASDLPPSEIEAWVDEAKRGMDNALRAKPLDIRKQYERQLKEMQEACGEAMLELRVRNSWHPCWARKRNNRDDPLGRATSRLRRLDQQAMSVVCHTPTHAVLPARQGGAQGAGTVLFSHQSDDHGRTILRVPDRRPPAGFQQEYRAANLLADALADEEATDRFPTPHPGPTVDGCRTQRTLAHRLVSRMDWARWLGRIGVGDRLPYARAVGLAFFSLGQGQESRVGAGAGIDCPLRHAGTCAIAVPAAFRQWSGLHQPQLHGVGSQLWLEAGVHHAALSGAKRRGRARDSNLEGAVRASNPIRDLAACQPCHWRLDQLLQLPTTALGIGDENPGRNICISSLTLAGFAGSLHTPLGTSAMNIPLAATRAASSAGREANGSFSTTPTKR